MPDNTSDLVNPSPEPTGILNLIKDLVSNVGSGMSGTTSRSQARSLGMPQAQGLDPQQLQMLMNMPYRQEQVANMQSLEENRKSLEKQREVKNRVIGNLMQQKKFDVAAKIIGSDFGMNFDRLKQKEPELADQLMDTFKSYYAPKDGESSRATPYPRIEKRASTKTSNTMPHSPKVYKYHAVNSVGKMMGSDDGKNWVEIN